MEPKQLFSFKSSNSVFKNRLRCFILCLLANLLLFLPARFKFFLIILFVIGAWDSLPGITNVYGLDGPGIEFSVLSRRTPSSTQPPLQRLSVFCRGKSGRSLVLAIHLLLVSLSNGLDL